MNTSPELTTQIRDMLCAQMPYRGSIISYDIVTNDGFGKRHMYEWPRGSPRVTRLVRRGLNPEFVCEKDHVCMLSTNVNQYLAFRSPHRTWWVYEWGAQVRKHKYGKSPHSKKRSSSQGSTIVPSHTTKSQKDISTLYSTILQYSKDPQDLQRQYNQDPP
jgi:hypothetical protein